MHSARTGTLDIADSKTTESPRRAGFLRRGAFPERIARSRRIKAGRGRYKKPGAGPGSGSDMGSIF